MNAKAKKPSKAPVPAPVEMIERQILYIRGQRVIIDNDLAELYHVTTGNLNLAVRRNIRRFPSDFMFRLTAAEAKGLLLQTATSHKALGTKLEKVEATQRQHASVIRSVVDELDRLKEPPPLPIKRRIGFAVQQKQSVD